MVAVGSGDGGGDVTCCGCLESGLVRGLSCIRMPALASERGEREQVPRVLVQIGSRSERASDACRSRNHRRTRHVTFCERKNVVAVVAVAGTQVGFACSREGCYTPGQRARLFVTLASCEPVRLHRRLLTLGSATGGQQPCHAEDKPGLFAQASGCSDFEVAVGSSELL